MHNDARGRRWRSGRLSQLGSSIFAEVASWKREAMADGLHMIDLGIGSPDRPPLASIRSVLSEAVLRDDSYAYPAVGSGMPFKEAAAAWMHHRFGVQADPVSELVTLMGSQDGLAHLAMAICDPGDRALLPDPGYPIYGASLALAGVQAELMPLLEQNHYLPDLDGIPSSVWDGVKFILVNYPNNPLSAVADLSFYERLLHKAKKHDVLVVHDLAYSELAFDGCRPPSMLQLPGAFHHVVEFHSLSKSFNMAGCRIGFLVGNKEAVSALRELKDNIDYGVFTPIQEAGIAALKEAMAGDGRAAVSAMYERRRDAFINALRAEGWNVNKPKATMFIWAKLPQMNWDNGSNWSARTFSREMLRSCGVAVIPGEAFGSEGEGYVRIALVEEEARLQEAARRIGRFIRGDDRS
ncbi:aminotransferase class I/II-fold pyridoxal phosphate-dependent enzyme [Paenibacillus chungangensis]|uniref:Aminotransferase n=1 Tax=Paenibacillus chungangensis TaxID=696535 RepID=A0ABW3HV49_9BACL